MVSQVTAIWWRLFGFGTKFNSRLSIISLPHSWIFDVFDEDGGGTIELDEVIKLVGAKNLKKKEYWTPISAVINQGDPQMQCPVHNANSDK